MPTWRRFQSTLPARGATWRRLKKKIKKIYFNPRSPHGERRACLLLEREPQEISIHAPRTGSDTAAATRGGKAQKFQSTLPARGATRTWIAITFTTAFQSTLPARGATRCFSSTCIAIAISIHAPRTGSDAFQPPRAAAAQNFNPRSPHGERPGDSRRSSSPSNFNPRSPHGERPIDEKIISALEKFQSTLPARGATVPGAGSAARKSHFNPRSPHGERPERWPLLSELQYFNPRSPHGERRCTQQNVSIGKLFQSTLPARGATPPQAAHSRASAISIHAPRTGSDVNRRHSVTAYKQISIHAPRTGSDRSGMYHAPQWKFQSTLPARGATPCTCAAYSLMLHFNPRSPHGERPRERPLVAGAHGFQSTLPARGAT